MPKMELRKLKIPEIAEKYRNKSDKQINCQMHFELVDNEISIENRWKKIKDAVITLTAENILDRKTRPQTKMDNSRNN